MSYIKHEHRHLGEDVWLTTSASAFAVHTWALDYCNEQATDGEIPRHRALRLQCPVAPADLPAAWAELVDAEVWVEDDEGFICPTFLAHGISAQEQDATRSKWAEDKRRQRLHKVGNHQLCTPRSCPAAQAEADGVSTAWGESTSGQVDMVPSVHPRTSGRSDQTRPDQTPKGSGEGRRPGPASAAAPPAEPGVWLDIVVERGEEEDGPGHVEISVTLREEAEQYAVQYGNLLKLALRNLAPGIQSVAESHGCRSTDDDLVGCLIGGDVDAKDPGDRTLWIRVPEATADPWHQRFVTALQPATYETAA